MVRTAAQSAAAVVAAPASSRAYTDVALAVGSLSDQVKVCLLHGMKCHSKMPSSLHGAVCDGIAAMAGP